MHNGNTRGKKGTEEIFVTVIAEFPQINARHQAIDPGSSRNTKILLNITNYNINIY